MSFTPAISLSAAKPNGHRRGRNKNKLSIRAKQCDRLGYIEIDRERN